MMSAYKEVWDITRRYWDSYGGWRALFCSPYFHGALLLLAFTFGTWSTHNWWSQVTDVLPDLLGFSLGGLAIFLGFGSDRFREIISGRSPETPNETSAYMSAVATFSHFIVIQVLALLCAVISAGLFSVPLPHSLYGLEVAINMGKLVLWAIGYLCFLYAILLGVASALALYRVADWFDKFQTQQKLKE